MKKLFVVLLAGFAFGAKAQNAPTKQATTIQHVRIALNGGFSQLLGKTSSEVPADARNYVSELKSGSHFGIDATYFTKSDWGIGAKFSQFMTSNSGTTNVNGMSVSMKDDIKHSFIGASFSGRKTTSNNKHTFVFAVALGYLGYNNDAFLGGQPVKITGETFGSALDAGYDFNLTKNIAIGAQINFTGGALGKLNYESGGQGITRTLDKDQKESMARMDISLGARFNF